MLVCWWEEEGRVCAGGTAWHATVLQRPAQLPLTLADSAAGSAESAAAAGRSCSVGRRKRRLGRLPQSSSGVRRRSSWQSCVPAWQPRWQPSPPSTSPSWRSFGRQQTTQRRAPRQPRGVRLCGGGCSLLHACTSGGGKCVYCSVPVGGRSSRFELLPVTPACLLCVAGHTSS